MQTNAMSSDFSWRNSVAVYMRMYRSLVPAARFLRPAMAIATENAAVRRPATATARAVASRKTAGSIRVGRSSGGLVPSSAAA